jgi:hypothetical protein
MDAAPGLPAVLDFAFMRAANDAAGGKTGTGELARMVGDDALYAGGAKARCNCRPSWATTMRAAFAFFLHEAKPGMAPRNGWRAAGPCDAADLRGVPTIYYGDEQGLRGRAATNPRGRTCLQAPWPNTMTARWSAPPRRSFTRRILSTARLRNWRGFAGRRPRCGAGHAAARL